MEAIEQWKATSGGGRGGKGLTRGEQPTGGRGSDTEPRCHVDPIGGCAPERMQFQNHVPPTFDLREEPGALEHFPLDVNRNDHGACVARANQIRVLRR